MEIYYCHDCAKQMGLIDGFSFQNDFTGSIGSYKFEKYIKHTTIPNAGSNIVSVFNDSDYNTYKDYIFDTASSGSLEIDNLGRKNIVWFANKSIGQTFSGSQHQGSSDSVKLVLFQESEKIHAFPTGSQGLHNAKCEQCGKLLLTM